MNNFLKYSSHVINGPSSPPSLPPIFPLLQQNARSKRTHSAHSVSPMTTLRHGEFVCRPNLTPRITHREPNRVRQLYSSLRIKFALRFHSSHNGTRHNHLQIVRSLRMKPRNETRYVSCQKKADRESRTQGLQIHGKHQTLWQRNVLFCVADRWRDR